MKDILARFFKFLGTKIWKYKFGLILLIVAAVVITLGYLHIWEWTGLTGTALKSTTDKTGVTTTDPVPVTLWNWIQVLIIPVVLAYAAYWLNQRQASREYKAATQRAVDEQLAADQRLKAEQKLAENREQATVLDSYLDWMANRCHPDCCVMMGSRPNRSLR